MECQKLLNYSYQMNRQHDIMMDDAVLHPCFYATRDSYNKTKAVGLHHAF